MHKLFKINNFDSEYSSKTIQGQIFASKNHVYDSRDLKSVMLKEIRVFNEKMRTTKKKLSNANFWELQKNVREANLCQLDNIKSMDPWKRISCTRLKLGNFLRKILSVRQGESYDSTTDKKTALPAKHESYEKIPLGSKENTYDKNQRKKWNNRGMREI